MDLNLQKSPRIRSQLLEPVPGITEKKSPRQSFWSCSTVRISRWGWRDGVAPQGLTPNFPSAPAASPIPSTCIAPRQRRSTDHRHLATDRLVLDEIFADSRPAMIASTCGCIASQSEVATRDFSDAELSLLHVRPDHRRR